MRALLAVTSFVLSGIAVLGQTTPPPASSPSPAAATPVPPPDPTLPAAEETAKAALEATPRHGEYVDVKIASGGAPVRAWISYPERKGKAGAVAVIQPGGSVKDEEVIAAADEHKLAMVFTGVRHFRH